MAESEALVRTEGGRGVGCRGGSSETVDGGVNSTLVTRV